MLVWRLSLYLSICGMCVFICLYVCVSVYMWYVCVCICLYGVLSICGMCVCLSICGMCVYLSICGLCVSVYMWYVMCEMLVESLCSLDSSAAHVYVYVCQSLSVPLTSVLHGL